MSDLKQAVRDFARQKGIDLLGFAAVDRFAGCAAAQHPQTIYPDTQSVIGLGFRVLRGSFRGVEAGSTFYQYYTTGVETIEEVVIPRALLTLAGYLEDLGYEAVIHKRFQTLMAQSGETNPETENHRIYKNISIEPQLDFAQAAVCCGLGELGLSDTVLTDDFGPFQRFAFILTNARFESDALAEPHLCDQCGACLDGCPGRAFKSEQTVRPIAGQSWPVHAKDSWQCAAYYKGAGRKTNPFMPPDALADLPDREAILNGDKQLTPDESKALLERLTYYPPGRHAYVASICGRACDRACYDHLEQTGKLKRRFAEPFRKAKPWSLGPAT